MNKSCERVEDVKNVFGIISITSCVFYCPLFLLVCVHICKKEFQKACGKMELKIDYLGVKFFESMLFCSVILP